MGVSVAQVGVAVILAMTAQGVGLGRALAAEPAAAVRPDAPPFVFAPKAPATPAGPATVTDPRDQPTIIVDPAACQWVSRHVPDADVEYRPGVDVDGNAVAPADLPGTAVPVLPRQIEIGITADVARRFAGRGGFPPGRGAARFAGEAYIGTVTVDGSRVLFNGQPVGNEAEDELVALCGRIGGGQPGSGPPAATPAPGAQRR
jgi:hypothetical protein